MDARIERDRELLSGADRLFAEAQRAQAGQDLAKAVDLYEKGVAVYSLVTAEFKDEREAAATGGEDCAIAIRNMFAGALLEVRDIMNKASQAELDGNYEQAIRFYERVPETVSVITDKYPEQYNEAQKSVQSAQVKKSNAQANLDALKTEKPGTRP
jgi:tetratricopeptide (TPR) repeat protein